MAVPVESGVPRQVAIVTNMWPGDGSAHRGLFVQQQVDALRSERPDWRFDVVQIAGSRGRTDYLHAVARLRRQVRGQYDLVHAHYGLTGVTTALAGVAAPTVLTLHGSDVNVGWQRALTRIAAARTDLVIAVSQAIADRMRGLHTVVLPCGVALQDFPIRDRAAARARHGIAPEQRLVLFPGDPEDPIKDYALFAEALAGIASDLRERVVVRTLVGLSPAEVSWLMSASDVVMLTSRSEGSPMVLKEALASGVPVVAVRVGDVASLLEGAPGCRVTSRSAGALSEALASVLARGADGREAERRDRIARLGLDGKTIAARLIELYEGLMRSDRGASGAVDGTHEVERVAFRMSEEDV